MKISTYALVLATLMTPAAWAGSHGNGHMQGTVPYQFCYGGIAKTEYFSSVFAVVPGVTGGVGKFGDYLNRMGYRNDGAQCRGAPTKASADAGKKQAEDTFRSAEYHHRTIVETGWSGT